MLRRFLHQDLLASKTPHGFSWCVFSSVFDVLLLEWDQTQIFFEADDTVE